MNTDPIADLLTRIRNACLVSHAMVECPSSNLKEQVAKLLLAEGYIRSYEIREEKNENQSSAAIKKTLRILLKYDANGNPVIRKIQRHSRPGLRKYYNARNLPRVLGGAGTAIVSTSRGLMPDRQCRKDGIGGEVLALVE